MLKLVSLFVFSLSAFAQNIKTPEYVLLADNAVYDVEIIIFAHKTALPNFETYTSKAIYDTTNAFELMAKPNGAALVKNDQNTQSNNGDYTINLDDDNSSSSVLAWFEHNKKDYQLTSIWNKLHNKNDIVPLIHRAWRQPETPFETPQYVKISTVNIPSENAFMDEFIYPDFALIGEVALSKGRYVHFGNHLNLFREIQYNQETQNMVFSLSERKQIKKDQLHYFDSPWLGAIVKITKFTGEQTNESTNTN